MDIKDEPYGSYEPYTIFYYGQLSLVKGHLSEMVRALIRLWKGNLL